MFNETVMLKAQKIFLTEVEDKLPSAWKTLELLEKKGFCLDLSMELYKFAHTLKGSGQTVTLWDIAAPAAEMVSTLKLVHNYGIKMDGGVFLFLRHKLEEISDALHIYKSRNVSFPSVTEYRKSEMKKILIVDDDPAITCMVKDHLEKEGFKVFVCNNTNLAESFLAYEQPDLIILDILLPTENGIEFCKRIRTNPHYQLVPIIFFSIKNDLVDKLAGFATGADDYLCKPISVEELTARIQAILGRITESNELILQDELTKVYNRRYFLRRLDEEIARDSQNGNNFTIAMLDIDYFKTVNDTYGHLAGDETLKFIVNKLKENLRNTDIICRFGGDEFIILLPDMKKEDARKVIERIRGNIASDSIKCSQSNQLVQVTCSVGVSTFPENGCSAEQLIKSADENLYLAKQSGRNCLK